MMHKGKSKQSKGNNRGQITKNSEGDLELDKKGRSSKQIHLQGPFNGLTNVKMPLQN